MVNLIEITEEDQICVICKSLAPHTCSGCKQVHYCSKEHQKQNWKEHKTKCRSFEVKTNNELGRYLVASRDVIHDEKLLMEGPLVFGPKVVEPSPICLGCYKPPHPVARCPRCFWPVCDPHCPGLVDLHHHAAECIVLSLARCIALQPSNFRYEIITPLRCMLLQKRNPRKWQQVINMEAHMELRGSSTDVYKYFEENVVAYITDHYLSKLEENSFPYSSKDVIHRICGVLDVNALEIRAGGDIDLISLYPTMCFMEHKCIPNTVYYFSPEFKITVKPATKISKGDHLSTMYTHVLWGTEARREHLKENKYFSCKCERCKDPTELGTYISALRCHGMPSAESTVCGGWQLPEDPLDEKSDWKCNKCSVTLTSEEARHLVNILSIEVENIQQDKPAVSKVVELIQKLEQFLHPHHYHCYEMKHLLIQLYGHQPGYLHHQLSTVQLHNKTEICRDLLSVNKILDPGYSRLCLYTAVLMFEMHLVLMELNSRHEGGIAFLKEAESLVIETIKILENEPSNSPGSELRILAIKSLSDVTKRLKAN